MRGLAQLVLFVGLFCAVPAVAQEEADGAAAPTEAPPGVATRTVVFALAVVFAALAPARTLVFADAVVRIVAELRAYAARRTSRAPFTPY